MFSFYLSAAASLFNALLLLPQVGLLFPPIEFSSIERTNGATKTRNYMFDKLFYDSFGIRLVLMLKR